MLELHAIRNFSRPVMLLRGKVCCICTVFFVEVSFLDRYILHNILYIVPAHRTIQGVTGGTDQTSGECSLGQTIPI